MDVDCPTTNRESVPTVRFARQRPQPNKRYKLRQHAFVCNGDPTTTCGALQQLLRAQVIIGSHMYRISDRGSERSHDKTKGSETFATTVCWRHVVTKEPLLRYLAGLEKTLNLDNMIRYKVDPMINLPLPVRVRVYVVMYCIGLFSITLLSVGTALREKGGENTTAAGCGEKKEKTLHETTS